MAFSIESQQRLERGTSSNMSKRKVGEVISAKVIKILDSGAIVSFNREETAFLHISELSKKFVKKVEDILTLNQKVRVEVIEIKGHKTFVSLKNTEEEAVVELDETTKRKNFEDKITGFLKVSSENQRQIQKSNDKKRGYFKKKTTKKTDKK